MTFAIQTKYLGPTNTLGSRMKATMRNKFNTFKHEITIAYSHELSGYENHVKVARSMAENRQISGEWFCGETEHGYVFVRAIEGFTS